MAIELHQLRYFVAVAEQRHFTKAARGLRIAQPSVSRAVHVLEEELGTQLFHRMKGNVALTSAGEVLLPWARRVLADVDGAALEVRELADLRRGRLAVGATPSLTTTLLPPALARFHAAFPGVELVLAVAPDHALASRKTIAIADLKGVPLVMFRDGYDLRASTLAAFRRAGFEPTLALEGGEMDGVLRLTAAGLGVAVVPSLVIDPAGPLRAVRLADPLTRTIGFANRRDRRLTRAGREFVETVRALVRGREWLRARPPGLTVLDPKS